MKNSIALFSVLFLFTSCESVDETAYYWGKTNYYSDFLFYKYKPEIMTNTLALDFNDDAGRISNIKFGVFKKNTQTGKHESIGKEAKLYKNNVLCSDNTFTVSSMDRKVDIGLEFMPKAESGTYKWYVLLIDGGGLDRINDTEIGSTTEMPIALEWFAKKDNQWNPLAKGLGILGLVVIGAFLFWTIILRQKVYPTFKVGAITISKPIFGTHKLRGCRKIVYTNNQQKQSSLNKLFTGRVIYSVNPIWTNEWIVTPRDKSSVRPQSSKHYILDPFTTALSRGTEYSLINKNTDTKISIIIN